MKIPKYDGPCEGNPPVRLLKAIPSHDVIINWYFGGTKHNMEVILLIFVNAIIITDVCGSLN